MRRREFITGLGGAAAWPMVARAQQPAMPTVGVLHPGSPAIGSSLGVDPFREGLKDAGFVEGRNVNLEIRWVDGRYDRLPDMVADLIRRKVAAIFAIGIATVNAAKAQTTTIPIIFSIGEDPIKEGYVASLNRPTGNITGFSNFMNLLGSKRLALLRESLPNAALFGILVSPTNPNAEPDAKDWQAAANSLGQKLRVFGASSEQDLNPAFAAIPQNGVGGLFVNTDPLFIAWREQIVALAARYAVPTMYDRRDFVAVGGLMSYGASETNTIRQAGIYVGRILKGEKVADLPVQQSTRIELVINMKAAKALGLTIPETLLATADQVIQ
jgi:putative ABC transport system substrate-binding protein